jgi:hypothetical protein
MAHNMLTVTPSNGSGEILINETSVVFGVDSGTGTLLRVITGKNVEKNILVDEDITTVAGLCRFAIVLALVGSGDNLLLMPARILTVEQSGANSVVKVLGIQEKKFLVSDDYDDIATAVNDLVLPDA